MDRPFGNTVIDDVADIKCIHLKDRTMLHPNDITGIVLAGGKSSRFGSNKALSTYSGKSFLEHIIQQMGPYTGGVIISGFYPEYENLGVPVLNDLYTEAGPLGGIYTALTYCTTPWMLVLTCDMPLITSEIIMHMLAAGRGENVVGWSLNHNIEVFPLLVSKNIIPYLEIAMRMKRYNVKQLFEWSSSKIIPIPKEWECLFANINTCKEYKKIIQ